MRSTSPSAELTGTGGFGPTVWLVVAPSRSHTPAPLAPCPTAAPRLKPRHAARALVVLIVLVAAAQVVFYFCRTVDDMFISLRFAERLVAGQGLTFNDGQRVEGFSNPLWVLLQAALIGVGVDGVIATKALALASYGLLFWGLYRVGRDVVGLSQPLALVALLLTAASSYIASWAMWGLETPLFLALLAWFLVALHRRTRSPTGRATVALTAATVAFVTTRPEAPLYVLAAGATVLFVGAGAPAPPGPAGVRGRFRALLPAVVATAVLVAALLLWRHAYYGRWLPQTYYAKHGVGFDPARLAPLVAEGASPLEIVYLVGATALAGVLAVRARLAAFLAVVLADLCFVASVAIDWMPNQRHFLPLIALAPFPWLWLVASLARRARAVVPAVALALIAGLLAGQAWDAFAVDARFSIYDFRSHGYGQTWVRTKAASAWADAIDGLRRTPPAHVAAMNVDSLGMIDQLFRILEASATPEHESWYVGRDIGRVGYYSPVQVFETAGLFTPALTASDGWRRERRVDDALVDAAFAAHPIATDLLDGWSAAVARRRDLLAGYEVLVGDQRSPVALRPKKVERPSAAELLARYDRVVRAFRTPFYQATLYGESVGAAVEKRATWIRPQLVANAKEAAAVPPVGLVPTAPVALLGGGVRLHGCRAEPPPAGPAPRSAGGDAAPVAVTIACYWEAARALTQDWRVFVHFVDAAGGLRAFGDHEPCVGLRSTSTWLPGRVVRDAVVVELPPELRAVALSVRVGLFQGARRAPAAPGPAVDSDGRIIGPTVTVGGSPTSSWHE